MDVRPLEKDRGLPLELLLEADPSEKMVRDYSERGFVYEATIDGELIGVYVLLPLSAEIAEIKNIAVAESVRGKGYGKKLILHALAEAERLG